MTAAFMGYLWIFIDAKDNGTVRIQKLPNFFLRKKGQKRKINITQKVF